MEGDTFPKAIFFLGLPGSGKDTQANLLTEEYGFQQVPSSTLLQEEFAARPDDPEVQREKKLFDEGFLNSGPFVAQIIVNYIRKHKDEAPGFVFSGSPRTESEARAEIPLVQEIYGSRGVVAILLKLDIAEARRRISLRRFCRANKHPIPGTPEFAHLKVCPKDGSELYTRPLDDAELQDTRFKEYQTLTEPTIPVFHEDGVRVYEIDGGQSIQATHQEVVAILERHHAPEPVE